MDKLISFNKNMLVCDSSKGIKLIAMAEHHHEDEAEEHHDDVDDEEEHHHAEEGHHHGGQDPHVWLSPNNAIVMASNIRDALIKRDPGNEKFYRDNASRLVLELSDLKEEIASELAGLKNRNFLVFHPSWGYFAADFNLNQIAIEQGGKDPTPKQLAHLIEEAKEHNTKVILVSPQFSQKSARTIADEINGRIESIDPLPRDYINNLRRLANILAGKQ
jgi:zinc transport system substrate-binding protein